jgi:hypothetical protein
MRGHDKMRQGELERFGQGRRLPGICFDGGEFAREAVRTQGTQQLKLGSTRQVRSTVGEVDDFALVDAVDRGVRLLNETLQAFGQPMISASRPAQVVHALLDDCPMPVVGDNEAVQIEVKTILNGGAVDLRHQPANVGEGGTVDSDPLSDRCEFKRRPSRLFAAAATDMDSEFAGQRLKPSFQGADHARGYARGMPVHAHDRAERLKPERMSEAAQQLVAAVMVDDRLGDDRAEAGHAVRQPQRHAPAVQRQIGASGSMGHAWSRDSFLKTLSAP